MPRSALGKKTHYIEIPISPDDKQAFQNWCAENSLTMSEVIRREISPFIDQGYNL